MSKNTSQEPEITWISSRKLKQNLRSSDQPMQTAKAATLRSDFTDGLWVLPEWRGVSFRFISNHMPKCTDRTGYHCEAYSSWGQISAVTDKDGVIHISTKKGYWPSFEHFQWTVNKVKELLPKARRLYGL